MKNIACFKDNNLYITDLEVPTHKLIIKMVLFANVF